MRINEKHIEVVFEATEMSLLTHVIGDEIIVYTHPHTPKSGYLSINKMSRAV